MTPDEQILQHTRQYVTTIFTDKVDPRFLFHNLAHTLDVVEAAGLLAEHYTLPASDKTALLLAAWFHDTGYSSGQARMHEEVSRQIATEFLQKNGVERSVIDTVAHCIMATKWPQCPTNLVEQLLCDADLFHIGSERFPEKNKLLRQELNELFDKKISKKEWRAKNIFFLQQHRYFTDFARTQLEPVKQRHLQELLAKGESKRDAEPIEQKIVTKPLEPALKQPGPALNQPEPAPVKAAKEKDKAGRTDRSIATMFRIMSENHVNLSQMADSKANIMISVNTIVMSIMVSVLLGKLQFYPEYIVPTIILLGVCLSAVVFAILATRPNITRGTFTKEDIQSKDVNLLFFGNFYNMSLPEYDWAMKEMMSDRDYLNSSMIKDIYYLGVVLARKYKYLRISYNIFMFGLILAILAFGIAFFFSEQNVGGN